MKNEPDHGKESESLESSADKLQLNRSNTDPTIEQKAQKQNEMKSSRFSIKTDELGQVEFMSKHISAPPKEEQYTHKKFIVEKKEI